MTDKKHINDSLKNSDKNFNENCTRDKKQIIVDGVDVKNCKGIDLSLSPLVKCKSLKFKTSDGGIAGIWCSDHTNCYFKQLARKTHECEQKDKEINELHLIIDRLLEASGYDKNINSAEDFEDVYADIDYKLGLLDDLKKECEALKSERFTREELISLQENDIARYRKALEEIEEIAKDGLNPICYKSNCSRCKCYNGDDCKAGMISLINNYFTENGEFADENGDFIEALEALIESERKKCNKAIPITQQVLDIIDKVKGKGNE